MQRAANGELDVMIGPRSALFTPFPNLGLIVIDEEHENSYKSEQVPRYHARETAIARAEMEHASVVLGSATPSMESYYRCQTREYRLIELKERVGNRPLPTVHTTDMREELAHGNRSIFSDLLREKIRDRLEKGQQTMLFIAAPALAVAVGRRCVTVCRPRRVVSDGYLCPARFSMSHHCPS